MEDDTTEPLSNILIGLAEEKQKFHKPRVNERIQTTGIAAMIEAGGQIFRVNLLDISQTVLRVDHKFPISMRENCVVVLKTNPALQLVCSPILDKNEFDEGLWCRLKIRSNFKFDQFYKSFSSAK